MTVFEFLSVALSLVIGLSVTRLLSAAIHIFVNRERLATDWIPIVWAVLCFAWQLQYWWAIYQMSQLPTWTFGSFLLLLLSAVLLYASSALVLPDRARGDLDLSAHFEAHGRWGVVFLMAYFLSAFAVGPAVWGAARFFGIDALPTHVLNLSTVILGLALFAAKGRRARAGLTLASVVVQGVMYFTSVPWEY